MREWRLVGLLAAFAVCRSNAQADESRIQDVRNGQLLKRVPTVDGISWDAGAVVTLQCSVCEMLARSF